MKARRIDEYVASNHSLKENECVLRVHENADKNAITTREREMISSDVGPKLGWWMVFHYNKDIFYSTFIFKAVFLVSLVIVVGCGYLSFVFLVSLCQPIYSTHSNLFGLFFVFYPAKVRRLHPTLARGISKKLI